MEPRHPGHLGLVYLATLVFVVGALLSSKGGRRHHAEFEFHHSRLHGRDSPVIVDTPGNKANHTRAINLVTRDP